MSLLAITGTSGVGKSFLEKLLHDNHNFALIPKYTTRELRPSEIGGNQTKFMQIDDFLKYKDFFWTLYYDGNYYGWKRSDLPSNPNQHVILAITIESAMQMIEQKIDATIVLLHIEIENIQLLRKRLEHREDYHNLTPERKVEVDKMINIRIHKAINEIQNSSEYLERVKNYGGGVFSIKDDSTIHNEVVPWILDNISKPVYQHSHRVGILYLS